VFQQLIFLIFNGDQICCSDEAGVTSTNGTVPRVCIATASPAKFTEVVTSAGLEPVSSQRLDSLHLQPTRYVDWERSEDWLDNLRKYVEKIASSRRQ
jgi:threonine synthase